MSRQIVLDTVTTGLAAGGGDRIIELGCVELLDRKLRLNLALYEFPVDGQQLVAGGGQFNTATLLNADQSKGYGFGAHIDWGPTPSRVVSLRGS